MQNIRPEDCHALRGGCRRFCMNFKDFKDSRIQGFEDAGKRTASLTPGPQVTFMIRPLLPLSSH